MLTSPRIHAELSTIGGDETSAPLKTTTGEPVTEPEVMVDPWKPLVDEFTGG